MLLEQSDRRKLLRVASASVRERVHESNRNYGASGSELQAGIALTRHGASFVTLRVARQLRGCIGSIEPVRPLIEDVWRNAGRSAAEDPRCERLRVEEIPRTTLEISVLGALEALRVDKEQQLRELLRPGIDGLLLQFGMHRATFLPKVWEVLPEPGDFLAELKRKMGMPTRFWDPKMEVHRYQTQTFDGALDGNDHQEDFIRQDD